MPMRTLLDRIYRAMLIVKAIADIALMFVSL